VNRSSVNVFSSVSSSSWSGHDLFDTIFLKAFGRSVPFINSLGVHPVELHTELFIQFSMCGSNSAQILIAVNLAEFGQFAHTPLTGVRLRMSSRSISNVNSLLL